MKQSQMKKLLSNKYAILLVSGVLTMACQHRKEVISEEEGLKNSKKDTLLVQDSARAIIHGSQYQEELDSLKELKSKEKRKK